MMLYNNYLILKAALPENKKYHNFSIGYEAFAEGYPKHDFWINEEINGVRYTKVIDHDYVRYHSKKVCDKQQYNYRTKQMEQLPVYLISEKDIIKAPDKRMQPRSLFD